MLTTTINYSTWYLKYRGVDEETRTSDVNMDIRELSQFKNEARVKSILIRCQCVGFDEK